MMVDTGLPRMAARVLAFLYTTDSRSLTAAELVRELPGQPRRRSPRRSATSNRWSWSSANPIRGGRREHYIIADDVWIAGLEDERPHERELGGDRRQGAELLGPPPRPEPG